MNRGTQKHNKNQGTCSFNYGQPVAWKQSSSAAAVWNVCMCEYNLHVQEKCQIKQLQLHYVSLEIVLHHN